MPLMTTGKGPKALTGKPKKARVPKVPKVKKPKIPKAGARTGNAETPLSKLLKGGL